MAEARRATRADRPATRAGGGVTTGPRRELVLAAVTVVGLSRLADGPGVWAVAGLLVGAILAGALHIVTDAGGEPGAARVESLLTPAVAAFACVGVIRLVPVGLGLVVALAGVALVLDRTIRTEAKLAIRVHGANETERVVVLVEAVVVSFLAFLGTAALVPGGLPEPGGAGTAPLSEGALLALAGADALVAGALGYRSAALRVGTVRAALWSAATYAAAIAIAAAALRAADLPRLIGPAMLTLVFFLWDAFHGAEPGRRRDPRWLWQTVLLAGLGLVVILWNLGLR
jgi:hypothetical protein